MLIADETIGRCSAPTWAWHCGESERGSASVMLAFEDETIVLFYGFIEKSRKAPAAEIEMALKRLNEMTS